MGLSEHVCEACRDPAATAVKYDRARKRWLCPGCWQVLGPGPGTAPHPEDSPEWKVEVRRRLT